MWFLTENDTSLGYQFTGVAVGKYSSAVHCSTAQYILHHAFLVPHNLWWSNVIISSSYSPLSPLQPPDMSQ